MSDDPRRSLERHVDEVVGDAWGMPVRAMEEVLARGEEAVEPVADALRRAVARRYEPWPGPSPDEGDEPPLEALWPAVLLGEIGSPRGAPALADAIRRSADDDHALREAAAEGLAKIGSPALDELRALLDAGGPDERLWAYAAAGWIRSDAAHALLLDALAVDAAMLDVVANALAGHGRDEEIPLLHDALGRAEPWMRTDLEDAIRELARGEPRERALEEDWRLRYRMQPDMGRFSPTWATVAAMARTMEAVRERSAKPARALEEILAEPWEDREPARCEDCGEAYFQGTGIEVCPETAVSAAMIQHLLLGEARTAGFDDLFDLMDELEAAAWAHEDAPEAREAEARERREDEETHIALLHGACRWLVGRGVEDVGGGRATLLAEAARLADRHGDPEGFLSGGAEFRTEGPLRAPETPGRNDPCPCGSGAKYKRCCGAPGPS